MPLCRAKAQFSLLVCCVERALILNLAPEGPSLNGLTYELFNLECASASLSLSVVAFHEENIFLPYLPH